MRFSPFSFYRTPSLYFGQGRLNLVGSLARELGERILLLRGSQSLRSSPYWERVEISLKESGLVFSEVTIEGEPTPSMVDSIVEEYGQEDIQVVISIGGGSVLDAGKAISAMLPKEGSVREYLEGVGWREHDGEKVPFFALPTTAGTGSEATMNAVLSEVGEKGFKKSLRHPNFVPDVAIIDPELTLTCPLHLSGACGMDAMTQLLESYVSKDASPLTDTLALEGLKHVRDSLLTLIHNPSCLDARESMSYASLLSGMTLANANLGQVHGLASAIGSLLPIPHGLICGVLLKGVTEATIEELLEKKGATYLQKYATLGALFKREEVSHLVEDSYSLVDLIGEYVEKLSLPRLGTFGFKREHLERVIKVHTEKRNPISLPMTRLKSLLEEQL